MTMNAQLYSSYLRPTTFFEDLALPESSGLYRSMDPFKFFENNLMREILQDSDDGELLMAATSSAVSRPRLPYAKFSASPPEDAAQFFATRPNSHDVSDNDEQTPQVIAAPAPVVDMRARRPPGNLTVVVNNRLGNNVTGQQQYQQQQRQQQRAPRRQKLSLKRHMDRVFSAQCDEQNANMLSIRIRGLNPSNIAEFILEH